MSLCENLYALLQQPYSHSLTLSLWYWLRLLWFIFEAFGTFHTLYVFRSETLQLDGEQETFQHTNVSNYVRYNVESMWIEAMNCDWAKDEVEIGRRRQDCGESFCY